MNIKEMRNDEYNKLCTRRFEKIHKEKESSKESVSIAIRIIVCIVVVIAGIVVLTTYDSIHSPIIIVWGILHFIAAAIIFFYKDETTSKIEARFSIGSKCESCKVYRQYKSEGKMLPESCMSHVIGYYYKAEDPDKPKCI